MSTTSTDHADDDVPPPGHFIRGELEAREWSQRDLAYILGVSDSEVNVIISGKRGISADMAKALGTAFDVAPAFFASLQNAYDLSRAREPDPNVARKARLQSAYPVREMIKRGWLTNASAPILEAEMARFFKVPAADIPEFAHAAKKSNYESTTPSQIAWLYRVKQLANEMIVPRYSEKVLREAVSKLRQLMIDPMDTRHVARLLADCGVRFVVVEALSNSKIDGACFWINRSPVIGMSLRLDRIDNFWFVLRHEIEHVLQEHGMDRDILDAELEGAKAGTGSELPEPERVANQAAAEFCVPTVEMNSFVARKSPFFSERDLIGFARRLQVHPGIVAGQLRRRIDRWDLFTKLLVKVRTHATSAALVDGWGQVAPVSKS